MENQKENFTEPSAEEQAQSTKFVEGFRQQVEREFCKKHRVETIFDALEKIGCTPLSIYHALTRYDESSKACLREMTGRDTVSLGDVYLASGIFFRLLTPKQQREDYQCCCRELRTMGRR